MGKLARNMGNDIASTGSDKPELWGERGGEKGGGEGGKKEKKRKETKRTKEPVR